MSQTARAISLVLLSAFTAFNSANAESHTVTFTNNCGSGTPIMIHHGSIVSYGGPYTVQGPLTAAIAYLQTGNCLFDGPNCATVELTLVNTASGPSSADISLIPPLAFSKPTGFVYYNACDGRGTTCWNEECPMAYRKPDDNFAQVICNADNASLHITFC